MASCLRQGEHIVAGCVHPEPLPAPTAHSCIVRRWSPARRWYKKYTPQECARLCSKISNFYGKTCTHFSRQWITSKVPEHSDTCGRDGEEIASDMPAHGAWGSAGTGTGTYTYRGQCLFFNSPNDHCCSTKAAWREAGTDTDNNYCQGKYGDREDNWNTKHRSWRMIENNFSPSEAWPVTSLGRRLSTQKPPHTSGEEQYVHELFFPNGTTFWAIEEEMEEQIGNVPRERADAQAGEEERRLSQESTLVERGIDRFWEWVAALTMLMSR